MHPVLLDLGFFRLPAYGFMVMLGYLAAFLYVLRRAPSAGLPRERAESLVFYTVRAGAAGAKLLYLSLYWETLGAGFGERLLTALKTANYGFVFYGGWLGGLLGAAAWCRRNSFGLVEAADLLAPALALAHAFGRVGCLLAGCCHGAPAGNLPGIVFTDPRCEVRPELLGVPLHPVQVYESAGNLLLFALLDRASRRGGRGLTLGLYMAGYALLRFGLEFLRGDDRGLYMAGLSVSQLLSLAVAAAGGAVIFYSRRTK